MILEGRVWKVGDGVSATNIVSAQHDALGMSRKWSECATHLLADVDPALATAVRPGDLLVAGRDFGTGHAHYYTTAIMAAKAAGLAAMLAEDIGGLFQRAAIDFGMPACALPGIAAFVDSGDRLRIDLATGDACNLTTGAEAAFAPLPSLIVDILTAGGSRNWALRRVGADHAIQATI